MKFDVPRVLIADGDVSLRQQLFSALLTLDIFCDCVSGVGDALAKLDEEAFGVVVIDVSLGHVEPLIERIARIPSSDRPVVLVLAGNPEAARSLDVEIVQIVLRKPVNVPQLVDVVRSCSRSSAARGDATLSRKRKDDHAMS